ncbi:hypothetical protein EFN50_09615 [Leuconostoc mesenteroides]|nr:hypothetical protein [Leuconostoc mesenteroides]
MTGGGIGRRKKTMLVVNNLVLKVGAGRNIPRLSCKVQILTLSIAVRPHNLIAVACLLLVNKIEPRIGCKQSSRGQLEIVVKRI